MKIINKIVILSLMLFGFVLFNSDKTEAASAIIDSYVKVNSVTKQSNGMIAINYTMKKDFNTSLGNNVYQSLNFVISMNSGFNVAPTTNPVNTKKGTYTLTMAAPSGNYVGAQIVEIKWGSGGQTASDRLNTFYKVPYTDWKSSGRTITKTEAVGSFIVGDILPGIAVTINPQSKALWATGKLISGWSALVGVKVAAGTMPGVPAAIAGQYWHQDMRYDNDGNIHVRTRVYVNETAKNKNEQTLYDNTMTMKINY